MDQSKFASEARKRRRVAKENRKRAERACERCQDRKSKCIQTEQGPCQRCYRIGALCRYSKERDTTSTPPTSSTYNELSNIGPTETVRDVDLELLSPAHEPTCTLSQAGQLTRHADILSYSISEPPGESSAEENVRARGIPTGADLCVDGLMQKASGDNLRPDALLSKLRESMFLPPLQLEGGHEFEQLVIDRVGPSHQEKSSVEKALQKFPPKPVAEFLTNICMDLGTDCFFYHNQKFFRRELSQLYAEPSCSLRSDCNFVCQALMEFALGSQFAALVSQEANLKIIALDQDPGRAFYEAARNLVPFVLESSTLRSIQTLFMMGVYLLPAKARSTAFMYMGMAMRMAIGHGLHRNQVDPAHSEEEREIRHRMWWALFSLERTISIKLNLLPTFKRENIQTPLPKRMPALDDDQPFDNIDHQVANSRLVLLLDEISETISASSREPLPLARLAVRLQEWKRSLPITLQLQHIAQNTKGFRTVIHLHQNYRYGWIILCKASLLTYVRRRLHHALVDPFSPHILEGEVEVMASHCIRAATKILHLFEQLYLTGSVSQFSFTDFQGVSIATIILLLGSILDKDATNARLIQFGINCLQSLAAGNTSAEMGVDFVQKFRDTVTEAAARLRAARPQTSVRKPSNRYFRYTTGPATNDYQAWLSWFSDRHDADEQPEGGRRHTRPPSMNASLAQNLAAIDEPLPQTVTPAETSHFPSTVAPAFLDPSSSPFDRSQTERDVYSNRLSMNDRPGNEEFSLLDLTGFDVLNWADIVG
ncbi:hypothetical protein PMIN04_010794 [Paraphaeosphaeria minitans]